LRERAVWVGLREPVTQVAWAALPVPWVRILLPDDGRGVNVPQKDTSDSNSPDPHGRFFVELLRVENAKKNVGNFGEPFGPSRSANSWQLRFTGVVGTQRKYV